MQGASFAEKTLQYKLAIEGAAILKEQRDEALDKIEVVEKEAHNAAIHKALAVVKNMNFDRWTAEEELEKLKI